MSRRDKLRALYCDLLGGLFVSACVVLVMLLAVGTGQL